MKKIVLLFICLLLVSMCACAKNSTIELIEAPKDKPKTTVTSDAAAELLIMPEEEPDIGLVDDDTMIDDLALITPTSEPTPIGMNPDPPPGPAMYSSYARMVSYDPARGWADFDYFDILTGDDAVQWLVNHEGYTLADAQAEVADWGDGEFREKNINTQVRTIDLKNVPIKLMYLPDGTQVPGSIPVDSTLADVFALYNLDPAYLFEHFFFYIHVDAGGNVTLVEQVYWC